MSCLVFDELQPISKYINFWFRNVTQHFTFNGLDQWLSPRLDVLTIPGLDSAVPLYWQWYSVSMGIGIVAVQLNNKLIDLLYTIYI